MAALDTGVAAAKVARPASHPWNPERGNTLMLLPPALLLLTFFIAPLANVVLQSFSGPEPGIGQYAQLVSQASTLSVLLYTFETAALVTIATILLAYPVAYFVSRAKGSLLTVCITLILVPFWTSTVIRTYAWMVILQRRGVLNDFLIEMGWITTPLRLMSNGVGMQIAMIHIMLPLMILPLLSTMRNIDGNLLRAAAVMGANPLRQFFSVYLPLSLPGVSAGSVLVFISSLGFYITPALLGGERTMVAVLIEQQASRLLNWPLASALATVLLVVTCALFVCYERIMRMAGGGSNVGEVE